MVRNKNLNPVFNIFSHFIQGFPCLVWVDRWPLEQLPFQAKRSVLLFDSFSYQLSQCHAAWLTAQTGTIRTTLWAACSKAKTGPELLIQTGNWNSSCPAFLLFNLKIFYLFFSSPFIKCVPQRIADFKDGHKIWKHLRSS